MRDPHAGLKRLDLGNYHKIEQAKQACERHYAVGCELGRAEKISRWAFDLWCDIASTNNLWRERTNLRTGSERLTGVGPPVEAHRCSPGPSLELLAWPSTPQGDTGNENLRQHHFDGSNLHCHLLGVHG